MNARRTLVACFGPALLFIALAAPAGAQAAFGIKSVTAVTKNEDKTIDLQAGSHPYEYTVRFEMNQNGEEKPEGTLSELILDLPPGMIGNPLAMPRCTGAQFEGLSTNCPGNTQIGIVHANVRGVGPDLIVPLYNLTPPFGVPASVGFSLANFNIFAEASIRTGSDYGATVSVATPTELEVISAATTIWGVPASEAHFAERQCINSEGGIVFGCPTDTPKVPFLTLPTSCTGPLKTTMTVRSLEGDAPPPVTIESLGEGGTPEGLNGCERPAFNPTIVSQPETNASDSPTGLHFSMQLPQNQDPEGTATAHLRDAVVTLPKGLAVNSSAADGLGACSPAQVGLKTPAGATPIEFTPGPAECPANSKVGTVEVETPLVDHPLPGTVYLAKQGENPFGSLIALYIAVHDPITGVVAKLPGKVEPDPVTGQLRTTVSESPQAPIEDFDFDFTGGPRAALTTPPTCGTYTTTTDLTPWTSPAGPDVFPSSSFQVNASPGGGGCVNNEAEMAFKPSFEAGVTAPLAGAYSPFVLKLNRENGTQHISSLNTTVPPGVTAKLAGVAECSEAQIAQAQARKKPGEGALEKASPSCPAASQLGVVNVGAGSGNPFFVGGNVYLAGPYKGAPLSLAIVVPAVAGPFDLGTVVVRGALFVNEETGQGTVKSDPAPTILQGVPIDVRTIAVKLDRPDFVLNPTSCEAKAVTAEAISTTGAVAPLQNHFQVGGCAGLGFKPNLSIRFTGAIHRRAHPKLIATLKPRPGDANISRAQVKLPKAAFLDNAHIGTVCTRVQFAAEQCPAASIYGRAEARTPLLGYPLQGKVYLRSSNHQLPDLVVAFKGPDYQPIKFVLAGRTDSVNGALRNTFEYAPDLPVSKFRLELFGGRRGLVILGEGLCAQRQATVKLTAHNGKVSEAKPKVQAGCGKGKKQKRARRRAG